MTRLKHLLELNDGGVWGDEPDGTSDTVVLRSTDIALDGSWSIDDPALRSISEPERSLKQLAAGDLVVVKSSGSALHLGKTALVSEDVAATRPCFANFVQRLRPTPAAEPRYLWYLLNSSVASSQLERLGTTSTGLRNLNGETLGEITVLVTTTHEQREIADYLDVETARIDALIDKKQRMMRLADERSRAVVDSVVGEWPERQLRRVVNRITSGPRGWAEYASDDGVPFLRITNVQRSDVELTLVDLVRVQPPAGLEADRTRAHTGDVLVSITADIGSVGIVRSDMNGAHVSQHLALLSPNDACVGEWLAFALSSSQAQAQLDAGRYGGTKTQLALEDVAGVSIGTPPVSKQEELLMILKRQFDALRQAKRALERQTGLLVEHRKALITAAVTGQLDVAKAAA